MNESGMWTVQAGSFGEFWMVLLQHESSLNIQVEDAISPRSMSDDPPLCTTHSTSDPTTQQRRCPNNSNWQFVRYNMLLVNIQCKNNDAAFYFHCNFYFHWSGEWCCTETWTITEWLELYWSIRRYRRMLKVNLKEHVTNEEVLGRQMKEEQDKEEEN